MYRARQPINHKAPRVRHLHAVEPLVERLPPVAVLLDELLRLLRALELGDLGLAVVRLRLRTKVHEIFVVVHGDERRGL